MLPYFYVYILGILSILSPCTIIIFPVLFSQVLGKREKLLTAILFSLGFSLSFAILGAITGFIGEALVAKYEPYFLIFAALVTAGMSLKFFKVIEFNLPSFNLSFFSPHPFLLGLVFGFVALSCISALLSAVFVFALAQKSLLFSIIIFLIYSLGYSTPLLAAVTLLEENKIVDFTLKHRNKIDFISGILLLLATIYLILNYFGIFLLV